MEWYREDQLQMSTKTWKACDLHCLNVKLWVRAENFSLFFLFLFLSFFQFRFLLFVIPDFTNVLLWCILLLFVGVPHSFKRFFFLERVSSGLFYVSCALLRMFESFSKFCAFMFFLLCFLFCEIGKKMSFFNCRFLKKLPWLPAQKTHQKDPWKLQKHGVHLIQG